MQLWPSMEVFDSPLTHIPLAWFWSHESQLHGRLGNVVFLRDKQSRVESEPISSEQNLLLQMCRLHQSYMMSSTLPQGPYSSVSVLLASTSHL